MSTINVSNLNDGTTTVATTYITNGSSKAWGSIDQDSTDHPTYDSFNVSSTVDNAAGKTTISFTTSMGNADYAIAGVGQADGESGGYFAVTGKSGAGSDTKMTASAFKTDNRIGTDGSNQDLSYMAFTIDGDLA